LVTLKSAFGLALMEAVEFSKVRAIRGDFGSCCPNNRLPGAQAQVPMLLSYSGLPAFAIPRFGQRRELRA
jgi:hypothetical protein